MICQHCNHVLSVGSTICQHCATPVNSVDITKQGTASQDTTDDWQPRVSETRTQRGPGGSGLAADAAAQAEEGSLAPGTPVGPEGRYRITRLLGKGGFAETFHAIDTQLFDGSCVIKRLRLDTRQPAAIQAEQRASLTREAELLVALKTPGHPNIPEVYAYLEDEHCLVMKYVEGVNLQAMMARRGGLPADEALRYITETASALIYMHDRETLHLDVKPANLLCDSSGRLWLIDFGIGRSIQMPGSDISLGTPGYTPPEQWRGAPQTASDVYALAVTLYVLLTNRAPNVTAVYGGARVVPPLQQVLPAAPLELAALLDQATSPDPASRPSMAEMFTALMQLRDQNAGFPAIRPPDPGGQPRGGPLAASVERLKSMPELPPDPEPLPIPHRMPLIRGQLFTGRDTELRELVRLLRNHHAGQAIAITGLGGVGKTSLASELVHRCGQFFAGGVFWINCAQPQTLVWEVAACGETGLVQRDDWDSLPVEDQARLVTQAWQAPVPRLLIFDNCEDDAVLQRWRPTSGGCRLVLTSQRARWSRGIGVTSFTLGELSASASTDLLCGYRPDLAPDDETLLAIADELACLPLALHLAGSYLETYQDDPVLGDPARFLQDLRATGPLAHDALDGADAGISPTAHELSVGRTFALSLARLNPDDLPGQQARTLLARTAYLAPGEPFSAELPALAVQADTTTQQGLDRLVELGLLRQEYGVLRIHRLVAEFARRELADQAAPGDVRRALIELTEQVYAQRKAVVARQILPHLALHTDAGLLPSLEDTVRLWNAMPFVLELVGDLAGGLSYLQRAQVALQQANALDSVLGAEVLSNLAEWQRALGETSAALSLNEQALAIRQRLLPPDDLMIGSSLSNLGETLRELGRLEEAQQAYTQALDIGLRSGDPGNEISLVARNHLALLLYQQECYAEARDQFAALLDTTIAVYGTNDPRTATVRNNLATALARQGEYRQARAEFTIVIEQLQVRLGDEHPETLRVRLNAARLLMRSGELAAAAGELRRLIDPLTAAYGAEHMLVQTAQETLVETETLLEDDNNVTE